MEELFAGACSELGGDGNYVALTTLREHAPVKMHFMKTLLKLPWQEETLAIYFQSRSDNWDFNEKLPGVRLRSELTKAIEITNREKRRTAQLPGDLYTAVLKAGNPAAAAGVISSAREAELAALPIDTFEALMTTLDKPPDPPNPADMIGTAQFPIALAGFVNAQVKVLAAIPASLEKAGKGLSQLMEYFKMIAKFGGAQANQRVAVQRIQTLKELCETAAVLILDKSFVPLSPKAIYVLCEVAPPHVAALAISTLSDQGDQEAVSACASHFQKIPVPVLEGLPQDTLVRLAVASTKSKAVAQEVLGRVAKAAGATLGVWSMDDVAKLLMAVAKAKAGSDSEEVISLYGRAAEAVAGKLQSVSDTQLIKVVLALSKVASMKDFLEAAAEEAVTRMPKITPQQLLFLTQGFLPLGAGHASLTKMFDFWSLIPDETPGHLSANQFAKLAQLAAPVAPNCSAFWVTLGRCILAGKGSLTDAGKASLEAAFPDGSGPGFPDKDQVLAIFSKAKESVKDRDDKKRTSRSREKESRTKESEKDARDDRGAKDRDEKKRSRSREKGRRADDRGREDRRKGDERRSRSRSRDKRKRSRSRSRRRR